MLINNSSAPKNVRYFPFCMKGYTLVEIIIVIVIMAMMAALGAPRFRVSIMKARARDAYANLMMIYSAQQLYNAMHNSFLSETTLSNLNTGLKTGILQSNNTSYSCTSPNCTATASDSNGGAGATDFQFTVDLAAQMKDKTTAGGNWLDANPSCTGNFCP